MRFNLVFLALSLTGCNAPSVTVDENSYDADTGDFEELDTGDYVDLCSFSHDAGQFDTIFTAQPLIEFESSYLVVSSDSPATITYSITSENNCDPIEINGVMTWLTDPTDSTWMSNNGPYEAGLGGNGVGHLGVDTPELINDSLYYMWQGFSLDIQTEEVDEETGEVYEVFESIELGSAILATQAVPTGTEGRELIVTVGLIWTNLKTGVEDSRHIRETMTILVVE